MAGGTGTPYRAPCTGWIAATRAAGCYAHRTAAERGVQKWTNETKVADYHDPVQYPGGIPPYPRQSDGGGGLTCGGPAHTDPDWPDNGGGAGNCPGNCNANCGNRTGEQKCNAWPAGERPSCPAPDATHATVEANCYLKATGESVDRSLCRKLGFKNVQARKLWHGRFGFLSHDPGGQYNGRCLSGGMMLSYESEQASADTTKYRTVTCESYSHKTTYDRFGAIVDEYSGTVTRVVTVGNLSGVLTVSGSDTGDASGITSAKDNLTASPQIYITDLGGLLTVFDATITTIGGPGIPTGDCGSWSYQTLYGDNSVAEEVSLSVSGGTVEYKHHAPGTGTVYEHYVWALTNTVSSWTKDTDYDDGSFRTVRHETITLTLSTPYTSADVITEVTGLLNYWPLNNDVIYPWRTDEYCGVAPLMSYNEGWAAVSPEITGAIVADPAWVDPNAATQDGARRGDPLASGQGPHFSWEHITWRGCMANGDVKHYRFGYGAWAHAAPVDETYGGTFFSTKDPTDLAMPAAATWWTENFEGMFAPIASGDFVMGRSAGDLPAGAWMFFAGGLLVAQKWAEIKISRPSHNFARPCGPDLAAVDQGTVRCAWKVSDSPLRVEIADPTEIRSNDIAYVCGVTGVANGNYRVTRIDDYTYELSAEGSAPGAPEATTSASANALSSGLAERTED